MKKRTKLAILLQIGASVSIALGQSNDISLDSVAPESRFGSSLIKRRSDTPRPVFVPAGKPAPAIDAETLRIETNLVVSDVLVLDNRGWTIKGLDREDFRVEEDGVPQQIEVFGSGGDGSAIARSIVLIIDYSGSQSPYIETSVAAAKILVDMLHVNDKMAIVTDDVELLTTFTSDKEVLKEKLESLRARTRDAKVGKSRQFSALLAVLNELFGEGDLRPKIIFQTDGDQYSAISRRGIVPGDPSLIDFTFEDVQKAADRVGTTIYSIYPGPDFRGMKGKERRELASEDLRAQMRLYAARTKAAYVERSSYFTNDYLEQWSKSRDLNFTAVSKLATTTGGFAAHLDTPENAEAVYSRILAEMNQRYVIGYYPSNDARDGKLRKIKITTLNGGHKILGRTSYIAPGPGH